MIKWLIIGALMAMAWLIQERVNAHDRLALKMFRTLDFGKIYERSAAPYFAENPEDMMMGQRNFQIRVVSFLKDEFAHRELRKIIKAHGENLVSTQAKMTETRNKVKLIAKQVAKSYEAMLRTPDADVSTRRRRR